jgi:hypothetical protein
MGYAEVYRKNRKPWKRVLRSSIYIVIFSVLLYFSLQLLGAQSGLMVGGSMPGGNAGSTVPVK